MSEVFGGQTPLEYCRMMIQRSKIGGLIPSNHLALCEAYVSLHDSCEKYKAEVMTQDCKVCQGRGERLWNDGMMHTCTHCGGKGYE